MKHYGDITTLNGADLPKVDVITGGSPCQDLSVAGNRKGLAGERSGLFIEQIRVIKEMRKSDSGRTDEHIRPRYMVWENVPGALSSNKGDDFRCVLEETARIADKTTAIPRPSGGKWSNSGCILGDGWSIAWRVHDAQFWGVPQRRKRIALVADFGGESAPEILFERESVSGDIDQSGETGQGTSTNTESGTAPSSYTLKIRGGADRDCYGKRAGKGAPIQTELSATLGVSQDQTLITGINGDIAGTLDASYYKGCGERQGIERDVVFGICSYDSNAMKSDNPHSGCYEADTARTLDNNGGNPACNQGGMAVVCIEGNGTRESHKGQGWKESETMYTLNTIEQHAVLDTRNEAQPVLLESNQNHATIQTNGIPTTLPASMGEGGGYVPMVCFDARGNGDGEIAPTITGDYQNRVTDYTALCIGNGQLAQLKESLIGAQTARGPGAICHSVVRRLTPLECERLQGYPDNWTNIGEWIDSKGKKRKDADSPRYKALGNSLALPFWRWMAARMVKNLGSNPTMGSLFDGIGGFPLVFQENGCAPVWASEIEEFPIAVTKIRFPEVENE